MRIALTSMLGGFAVSAIGLYYGHTWWSTLIGFVVGLILSWILADDAKSFARGAAAAWQEVTKKRKPIFTRLRLAVLGWSFVFALSIAITISVLAVPMILTSMKPGITTVGNVVFYTYAFMVGCLNISIVPGNIITLTSGEKKQHEVIMAFKHLALWCNPVGIAIGLLNGIKWLVSRIPAGLRATGQFMVLCYRYTVNNKRLCAAFGTAIGGAGGLLAGNPLGGAVVGFVAGFALSHLHKQAQTNKIVA